MNITDLFKSYEIVNDPSNISIKKYNPELAAEALVSLTNTTTSDDITTKVQNAKSRMSSSNFSWTSSGTEKTTYDSPRIQATINLHLDLNLTQQNPNLGLGISNEMFENLVQAEGGHSSGNKMIAHAERKSFGEGFVTGPYGMVYKHIDNNGNLLSKPQPFKEGEKLDPNWARANAKAYYDKKADEWRRILQNKPDVTQDKIDALVSASGGTTKSYNATKNFVTSHWGDWKAIDLHLRTHATTAAGNGKVMRGLLIRRHFEADWFAGNRRPYSWYLQNSKLLGV